MAQAAPIVINDGQATPVAVTFNPESITPSESSFVDRLPGVAIGFRRVRAWVSLALGKSTVNKCKMAVSLPVLQTVNGVSTVAYTLRSQVEMIIPDQATDAQRKDLYAFTVNGMQNALMRGVLRDLDPLY